MPSTTDTVKIVTSVTGVTEHDLDLSPLGMDLVYYFHKVRVVVSRKPFKQLRCPHKSIKKHMDSMVLRYLTEDEISKCIKIMSDDIVMRNIEIILDNDMCSGDWEFAMEEFNRFFELETDIRWECGTGCSIQRQFSDYMVTKFSKNLKNVKNVGKFRIVRVEVT